jgi:trehalose-6-phosphatase
MEDLGIVGRACDLALAFGGGGPEALGMAGEHGACVNYTHMYR